MDCEKYEYDTIDVLQLEDIKYNILIKEKEKKRPLRDVFSSYLVIFPATLSPFYSEWVTSMT